jgi:hypothetical protein
VFPRGGTVKGMTLAQGTKVKVAAGEHEGRCGIVVNDRLDVMLDGDGFSSHFDVDELVALVPVPSTQTANQTIYWTA